MSEQDRITIKNNIAKIKVEAEKDMGGMPGAAAIDALFDLLQQFFCDVNRIADASENESAGAKH